jgi:hypothetical protein
LQIYAIRLTCIDVGGTTGVGPERELVLHREYENHPIDNAVNIAV